MYAIRSYYVPDHRPQIHPIKVADYGTGEAEQAAGDALAAATLSDDRLKVGMAGIIGRRLLKEEFRQAKDNSYNFV